jgi:23S rRNA (adenine2503-C2)-methyltransferase
LNRLPHLRGFTPEGLSAHVPGLPLELSRRVLSRLVFEDRDDLRGVPGLSRVREAAIYGAGRRSRLEILDRRQSLLDPFVKYLLASEEGGRFETVRIPLERPRYSVCVSSQAGCPVGCLFCATGRGGFERNLQAWEIVEQVLTVRRDARDRPVTGVVFQGQGEPFLNYDNVIRAAEILRSPSGARIRGDRITISTVGILPAIEQYTEEGHPYRLILSLTSAFPETRARLVPSFSRYPVDVLVEAMKRHARKRGGPVHLAWVLLSGINTSEAEAAELARLFQGFPVRLSVIDVNDPTGAFRPASDGERGRFLSALGSRGIAFVRRYSGGPDIHAACGMLASSAVGGSLFAADPAVPGLESTP